MITVRAAEPEDGSVVDGLRDEARRESAAKRGGTELLADFAERSGEPTPLVLVAFVGEAAVGFASGSARGSSMHTRELFVTPEIRGVGVGSALLDALVERSRDLGCETLDALALPGDRETKNFFESHGLTARRIVVGRSLTP